MAKMSGRWIGALALALSAGAAGAAELHIKAVSPTDREFSLEGEVGGGG